MNEKDNFLLGLTSSGAIQMAEQGANHFLSGMITATLALRGVGLRTLATRDDP